MGLVTGTLIVLVAVIVLRSSRVGGVIGIPTTVIAKARQMMAIGSQPEVGTTFAMWKDMTEQDRQAWFTHIRTNWQPYLMAGYATLVHNKDNPYYKER